MLLVCNYSLNSHAPFKKWQKENHDAWSYDRVHGVYENDGNKQYTRYNRAIKTEKKVIGR